jgi:hypothetical protein
MGNALWKALGRTQEARGVYRRKVGGIFTNGGELYRGYEQKEK